AGSNCTTRIHVNCTNCTGPFKRTAGINKYVAELAIYYQGSLVDNFICLAAQVSVTVNCICSYTTTGTGGDDIQSTDAAIGVSRYIPHIKIQTHCNTVRAR